ncbi:transmembrane amino acid transporter protein-domain-containing protein [Mycena latifolia]|nr:transmembrane amino acid transporter protein-domain-containing protein [Mycena latifolia]
MPRCYFFKRTQLPFPSLLTMEAANEKSEKLAKTPEETSQDESTGSPHGSSPVPFEAYLHFAALQRSEEANYTGSAHDGRFNSWLSELSSHKGANVNIDAAPHLERHREIPLSERETASRALRLASWSSVFYLITTDILGPFNAPFAISQVGWVPGVILYFFMGLIALYTGLLLWRLFIRLDSVRYPILSYADIVERIFGTRARRVSIVLQSVQLVVFVGIICLGNAQALVQVVKHRLCFSVCIVIWALVGMVIGQIRTLKSYGWLANAAVWFNLLIIFTSMGFVAHSPPNFAAALSSLGVPEGPVETQLFAKIPLFSQVNGIMNMVYAYGGAMIFPEMLAEMRRPMDFWKGMILAQSLIFSAYLVYGAFVYSQQGQFTLPLAFQGVSKYAWQSIGNVLSLVSGIIAAGLYGNIGIKVVYHNIIEDWYNGPPLLSTKGRYIWSTMVCLYWALAFVIGSAIPQIQTINGLIGAIGIMQFTYTFPPLLRFGYDVISDAMMADKPYDPVENRYHRVDSWSQWSRWKRGLFSGRWYFKLFNFILFLASLAMAGLGLCFHLYGCQFN